MRVEIWSDLICPFCGIGNHQLEQALARFEHRDQVEVVHRSFQLDESVPEGTTEPVRDMLHKKKGVPLSQVGAMTGRIEQMAASIGLSPYVVLDNRVGNTSLAHELAAFATTQGRGAETWRALYQAYFGRAQSIFDVDSLVAIATEVGLDSGAAREALEDRRFRDQVRADGHQARELGASGVPFYVIDRRYAVAGAQPVEQLVAALESAWQSRPPTLIPVKGDGEVCDADGCAVPGHRSP